MKEECHRLRKMFSGLLDGELGDADRAALEAHLKACDACREELALWRRTLEAVSSLPTVEAPTGFADRVAARIERGGAAGPGKIIKFWSKVLPVAAMFVLVSGLTLLAVRNGLFERSAPGAPRERPEAPSAAEARGGRVRARAAADLPPEQPADGPAGGRERRGAGLRMGEQVGAPPRVAERELALSAPKTGGEGAGLSPRRDTLESYYFGRDKKRLAFRQVPEPAAPRSRPQQVLTMNTDSPTELLHRTVRTANENGLTVALELRDERAADLFLEVPRDAYDRLLRELAVLPKLKEQRLANTEAAQGEFFDLALKNYVRYREAERKTGERRSAAESEERLRGAREELAEMRAGQDVEEKELRVEDLGERELDRSDSITLQVSIEPAEE